MFECDIFQIVIFKSGAVYEFRRTIYLPSPPAYNVFYRGLIPGPTDEGEEFSYIMFDINEQKYMCELDADQVDDGRDMDAVIRFYGPEWTFRESQDPTPI